MRKVSFWHDPAHVLVGILPPAAEAVWGSFYAPKIHNGHLGTMWIPYHPS